jgi:short-subunit dehydrogenase
MTGACPTDRVVQEGLIAEEEHMQRSQGHVAVTGASAGIGLAIARAFAKPPNKLTLVARRRAPMEALAAEALGVGVPTYVAEADMNDLYQATAWVDEAEQRNGPIDVLVLNAGVQKVGPALSFSVEDSETQLRVNVMAPLRLARKVAPGMVARGRGTIVVVSSMSGIAYTPQMADYSASKAAVSAFFETLGVELEGTGVHVLTVYPGPVTTDLETAARAKLEDGFVQRNIPTGKPDELAELVQRAIEKRSPRLFYPRFYAAARFARVTSQWLTYRFAPRSRG